MITTLLQYYFYFCFVMGAIVALFCGFFALNGQNRKLVKQTWLSLNIFSALWSMGYFFIIIAPNTTLAREASTLLHGAAFFIPCLYLHFVLAFTETEKNKLYRNLLYAGYISAIVLVFWLDPTFLFVKDVVPRFVFNYTPLGGPLFFIFAIHFWWIVSLSGVVLYKEIKKNIPDRTVQLKFILWGGVIGFIGGGSTFLYSLNIDIAPYAIVLFMLYPIVITYAIVKHRLFNIKIIITEIFVFMLWFVLLARTIFSNSRIDLIINSAVFFLTLIIGIYLIRSVYREVSQRERIELLASDLKKANDRLTELDRQKSEFVSFATHQLRAPLTAMKGYASLMLEGDMGKLPDEAKKGVERIYDSTKTLTSIVDDYLNVSRIELGTMKYAFETIDLKMLVEDTIGELKPNIDKSGLAFSFTAQNGGTDWRITADRDKLKQVIANVIDNSMKYTPKGSIAVTLELDKSSHKFLFKVKDTGVGIAAETLPRLFQKFSRADNANKVNIRGTGLGLYVAKQMVEAHHGTIHAESEGEGKGSTFVVELEPLSKV